MRFCEFCYNL